MDAQNIRLPRILIAISLSVSVLLGFWIHTFSGGLPTGRAYEWNLYYRVVAFDYIDHITGVIISIGLALAAYLVLSVEKRLGRVFETAVKICLLLALLHTANVLRVYFTTISLSSIFGSWLSGIVAVGAGLAVVAVILRWLDLVANICRLIAVFLSPVALIIVANVVLDTAYALRFTDTPFAQRLALSPEKTATPKAGHTRVMVFVYDQLGRTKFLDARPPGIQLQHLDTFIRESWQFGDARPAVEGLERFHDYRMLSYPAMMTGRKVVDARAVSRNELMIKFEGAEDFVPWSAQPNLLSDVAGDQGNAAILGQMGHPYCRLFHDIVTACAEIERAESAWKSHHTLFTRTNEIIATALGHLPVIKHLWGDPSRTEPEDQRKRRFHRRFLDKIKDATLDMSLDVVFIHWFVTHGDYGQYVQIPTAPGGAQMSKWHRSVKLMDEAFGEVRQAMSDAGIWDQTAVILLSDRGAVFEDMRYEKVPFMVKLAGQDRGGHIDTPFSIVHLRDLVKAIRQHRVTGPSSLIEFVGDDTVGR